MKARTAESPPQDDRVRSGLQNLIAPRHRLVPLVQRIDCEGLNTEFGAFYEDAVVGQPPKATRLMLRLLCLKHAYSISDEALLERWVPREVATRIAAAPWTGLEILSFFCDDEAKSLDLEGARGP